MSRIFTLAWFLAKDFSRSWRSAIPLGLTAAFYAIAFQYGANSSYFIAIIGGAMSFICALTVLMLSGRFNRTATTPFVTRLAQRSELILAVALVAVAFTTTLTMAIVSLALWQNRLLTSLEQSQWVLIWGCWLILFTFVSVFGLLLTNLVSRGESHLFFYLLVGTLAAVHNYEFELTQANQTWVLDIWQRVLWPLGAALAPLTAENLIQAMLILLGYALVCFILADWFFTRKDLLWDE